MNVGATPDLPFFNCDPTCPAAFIPDRIGGSFVSTPAGVITSFRFQGSGPLSLVAYHPQFRDGARIQGTRVGISNAVAGGGRGVTVSGSAQIPVAAGDVVGLLGDTGAEAYGFDITPIGVETWTFGAPENGAGGIDTVDRFQFELFLQATVEPDADADGDGFGDETQDGCPSSAASQGACPAPPPPPPPPPAAAPPPPPPPAPATPDKLRGVKLATKSVGVSAVGVASIALTNPNAYGVKGTMTVRRGPRAGAAPKSFTLIAGATRIVKVKLSAAARRGLRIGRNVALRLAVKTTGPKGTKSVSATLAFTAKRGTTRLPGTGQPAPSGTPGSGTPAPATPTLDGAYARPAAAAGPDMTFTVTGGGRRIENFRGLIGGSCFAPGTGVSFLSISAFIAAVDVAADGTFSGSQDVEGTTTEVTGRLNADGTASGTVKAHFASCATTADFTAARTG